MIMRIEKVGDKQTLTSVRQVALNNIENTFVRRSKYPNGLYVKFRINDYGTFLHFMTISENCDILDVSGWEASIGIEDAIATDWEVYKVYSA